MSANTFLVLCLMHAVTAAEERTDTLGFTTLTHSTLTLNWRHKYPGLLTLRLQITSHTVLSGLRDLLIHAYLQSGRFNYFTSSEVGKKLKP